MRHPYSKQMGDSLIPDSLLFDEGGAMFVEIPTFMALLFHQTHPAHPLPTAKCPHSPGLKFFFCDFDFFPFLCGTSSAWLHAPRVLPLLAGPSLVMHPQITVASPGYPALIFPPCLSVV